MRRRLGQHFLVDQTILKKLSESACPTHTRRVIEIGPGRGALTQHLLAKTDELHAIEIDSALAQGLQARLTSLKLHVHVADVLRTDLTQWGEAAIAGNLPYYITSPIIEQFLALPSSFPRAVFLMQKEVAERVVAKPGTRDYGYLSVVVQLICEASIAVLAPPSVFRPPPKVDSAAVLLLRRTTIEPDTVAIRRFVSQCFFQKRKTLRNNLRASFGERINAAPEAGLRAEQLSPGELAALFRRLSSDMEH